MSKKILIVDDEDDIITFLRTVFRKAGYETVTANNGEEALKTVREEEPDMITLDLQMPKNTGTDFYRNIRKDKKYADIPVVVVSGLPGRHLAVPRPVAVFEKPIDPDELLKVVKETLGE
ncbi:MAG: response regulator [candidate division Zixibacteria bacterium]|nr:response regulator [candidate division Zixibacteria bacterium]